MDPITAIGLVASIAQLIEATTKAIKYLNSVKDAPQDRAKLVQEAISLLALLTDLNYTLEGANTIESWLGLVPSRGLKDVLDRLQRLLGELAKKLKPEHRMKDLAKRLVWTLDKKEISETLAQIERVKSLVGLALHRDHMRLSLAIKADITDVNANLRELGNNVLTIVDGITELQINQQDQECRHVAQRLHEGHQAAVDWLSQLNFSSRQIDVFSQHQEGTGGWLLEEQAFKRWRDGNQRVLWCPGLPGAGKTILASTVIDHLQRTYPTSDVGIAFVYCDYKEQEQQTCVNLVSSLLQQLVRHLALVPDEVCLLWEKHKRERTRPGIAEFSKLFQSTAAVFSRIFIVVDALDECGEVVRNDLIAEINKLPQSLQLMGTSRHNASIEQLFSGSVRLEILATDGDVKAYVRTQINRRERLKKFVQADPSLQEEIETKITNKAQGMFLLARLHIESLGQKHDRKAVRKALERLPEKLNDTYDEALKRIESQNEDDVRLARRILAWISFATRPLKVDEMQHAIAVMNLEPEENCIEEDGLPDKDLLVTVCAGIVIIDRESDVIRLVHYTTQEYFEQKRLGIFPDAQGQIANACLTYLSLNTFMDGQCSEVEAMDNRLRKHSLLLYAAHNWGVHAQGPPEKVLSTQIVKFLDTRPATEGAIEAVEIAWRESRWFVECQTIAKGDFIPGIAYAAYHGLTEIVGRFLERGCDINECGNDGMTALHRAAAGGHAAVVNFLLEQGAKPDPKTSGWTPLLLASRHGHEMVVKLLLDQGANIENKDDNGDTSLSSASWHGYEMVVRLLLNWGANVESKDFAGDTPLSSASERGHEVIVKLLLDQGADVESENDYEYTPLLWASARGHEMVVKLLLNQGADIESKDIRGQTAVSYASEKGQVETVKLLLERGANINLMDVSGRTALFFAAAYGHEAVVKLLLARGAELNAEDIEGHTALWRAVHSNSGHMVKLLLEHHAQTTKGMVDLAAGMRDTSILKLLLEHGAEQPATRAQQSTQHLAQAPPTTTAATSTQSTPFPDAAATLGNRISAYNLSCMS